MKTYPIFLVGLDARRSVVVGGGAEAERKISGLLECDAQVTVIAPALTERLRAIAATGRVSWIARDYRAGDLAGAFLVIAAEQDRPTREAIWAEARTAGALVNVMDDPAHCNFIAGSVVRRGALAVAISTGGAAPALAVRLRERLERELGSELGELLEILGPLRERVARLAPDFDARRRLWYRLVDSDVLAHLRSGRREAALARIEELLARDVGPSAA